jgi:hypothetical protein
MRDPLRAYAWKPQPEAAAALHAALAALLVRLPQAVALGQRLRDETGTRLVDWIDHLQVPETELAPFRAAGFVAADDGRLVHPGGIFPAVVAGPRRLALRVEDVVDALAALGSTAPIHGDPGPGLRAACLAGGDDAELWLVSRCGYDGIAPTDCSAQRQAVARRHAEAFLTRPRPIDAPEQGFAAALARITAAVGNLGADVACDLFFAAERTTWQRRNRAGQVQRARQDRLGLGWANHDHHTYRSSRACFPELIRCLEALGMHLRERFYAGAEAGWGAQVLEHPVTRIAVFADLDLSPEELRGDFGHQPLPERDRLGTVGLWCALHGEAFLSAGMHHLEITCDFDRAREQLAAGGVASLPPFTDFPHLRQAFTAGERWPVDAARVARLVTAGLVTAEQAERLVRDGALGAHLELLERNDGFKGFNQTGISDIIARTDPRR